MRIPIGSPVFRAPITHDRGSDFNEIDYWFVPGSGSGPSAQQDEYRLILRRFSIAAWTAIAAGLSVTGVYMLRGAWVAGFETTAGAIGIELARRWAVRPGNTSRLVAGTHMWIGVGAVCMVSNAMVVGQDKSVTMWYFCAVPMIAAHICSLRAARQWLFISILCFGFVYSLHFWSHFKQELIPNPLDLLSGQVVMAAAMFLFALSWRDTAGSQLLLIREQAAELEVARDGALAASRAKSDFLANMSHELRTPLHGASASLDLLQRQTLAPEATRYVAIARLAIDQATRIVDDILDLAKIESGVVTIDEVAFVVSDLVAQASDVVHAVAESKGLSLTAKVDDSVPPVLVGDAAKIRRVLVNLLGNAVKFTEEGSVSLVVSLDGQVTAPGQRTEVPGQTTGGGRSTQAFSAEMMDGPEQRMRSDMPGDKVLLSVSVIDTGIGIHTWSKETVFEKFEQEDTSTTRKYGGTGLGLSISKELTELMDGSIEVESEPGKGSTFTLLVPVTVPEPGVKAATLAPLTNIPEAPVLVGDNLGPETGPLVMVVDDNALNASLAGEVLNELGCRSIWTGNGFSAIEAVRNNPDIRAVLLDMHLPEMHGTDLARRIQSLDFEPEPPKLICLSADVSESNVAEARETGIEIFLGKPARLAQVRNALRQVGVLQSLVDVAPLNEAKMLIIANEEPASISEATELIGKVHNQAQSVADNLRNDPASHETFCLIHEYLVGGLAHASALISGGEDRERKGDLCEKRLALALEFIERAIHWEDN